MEDTQSKVSENTSQGKECEDIKDGGCVSTSATEKPEPSRFPAFTAVSPEQGQQCPTKYLPQLARSAYNQVDKLSHKAELIEITSARFENWLKKRLYEKSMNQLSPVSSPGEGSKSPMISARRKCLSVPPPCRREKCAVNIPLSMLAFFLEGNKSPSRGGGGQQLCSANLLNHLNLGSGSTRFKFPSVGTSAHLEYSVSFDTSVSCSSSVGGGDNAAEPEAALDYSDEEVFVEEQSKGLI